MTPSTSHLGDVVPEAASQPADDAAQALKQAAAARAEADEAATPQPAAAPVPPTPSASAGASPTARRRALTVGDYSGLSAADAIAHVRDAGLRPSPDRHETDDPAQHGVVLAQEPAPGSIATRGEHVVLYVGAPVLRRSAGIPVHPASDLQAAPAPSMPVVEPELAAAPPPAPPVASSPAPAAPAVDVDDVFEAAPVTAEAERHEPPPVPPVAAAADRRDPLADDPFPSAEAAPAPELVDEPQGTRRIQPSQPSVTVVALESPKQRSRRGRLPRPRLRSRTAALGGLVVAVVTILALVSLSGKTAPTPSDAASSAPVVLAPPAPTTAPTHAAPKPPAARRSTHKRATGPHKTPRPARRKASRRPAKHAKAKRASAPAPQRRVAPAPQPVSRPSASPPAPIASAPTRTYSAPAPTSPAPAPTPAAPPRPAPALTSDPSSLTGQ